MNDGASEEYEGWLLAVAELLSGPESPVIRDAGCSVCGCSVRGCRVRGCRVRGCRVRGCRVRGCRVQVYEFKGEIEHGNESKC